MALTDFQRSVCQLIAQSRRASGESYVAGGTALNEALQAPRLSRDVDLFHDTDAALQTSVEQDRALLESAGHTVKILRERPSFVEASISKESDNVLMQWARDSAFRFFPLVEHSAFGLSLHPLDLATNKVLALVGRVEARDWVDTIYCSERLQSLGYLAWAATGKDPGFSPSSIVEQVARTRYAAVEIGQLAFDGPTPDAADLSQRWHACIDQARRVIPLLPAEHAGSCVLDSNLRPFLGDADALRRELAQQGLVFRPGSIRGVLPELVSPPDPA